MMELGNYHYGTCLVSACTLLNLFTREIRRQRASDTFCLLFKGHNLLIYEGRINMTETKNDFQTIQQNVLVTISLEMTFSNVTVKQCS